MLVIPFHEAGISVLDIVSREVIYIGKSECMCYFVRQYESVSCLTVKFSCLY